MLSSALLCMLQCPFHLVLDVIKDMMIVNNELKKIRQEAVVALRYSAGIYPEGLR
jgi:hypothetical protein